MKTIFRVLLTAAAALAVLHLAGCRTAVPARALPMNAGLASPEPSVITAITTSFSPLGEEWWSVETDGPCPEVILCFAMMTQTPVLVPGDLPRAEAVGNFEGRNPHEIIAAICEFCVYSCPRQYVDMDGVGIVVVGFGDSAR